ncbi:MAG: response regulator [Ardenticatenaceae bacterium]|nr:response regulator [Anaerolineales bacterium]MCB8917190.1 response regulator [Ardenticatenaceae bacterium]
MNDSRKTVLCVEDNPTNMLLVARIIEAEGYTLLQSARGDKALEILQEIVPDLVLLDINVPGLDGLELAREMRQDPRLQNVPIIATTANVLVGDRERCLEAGCDEYMPKPLDIRRLRQLIRSFML